jgi:hypothetical protein
MKKLKLHWYNPASCSDLAVFWGGSSVSLMYLITRFVTFVHILLSDSAQEGRKEGSSRNGWLTYPALLPLCNLSEGKAFKAEWCHLGIFGVEGVTIVWCFLPPLYFLDFFNV